MTAQAPFVGRIREIEEFENLLEAASGGSDRLLLVAGYPGACKTSWADCLMKT